MKSLKFILCGIAGLLLMAFELGAQAAWGPGTSVPHNHRSLPYRFIWPGAGNALTKSSDFSASKNHKVLVILGEFSDAKYFNSKQDFVNMLTLQDYKVNGAVGSANQYLVDQTGHSFEFTVVGPVAAPRLRNYYGANDTNGSDLHPGEFIAEICKAADVFDPTLDFSKFDTDGDGYVDNVFVFFAGGDEAMQPVNAKTGKRDNEDFIWSHSHVLEASDYGKSLTLDGVKIGRYSCAAELYRLSDGTDVMAPIGTFCHEYLHSCGLADLYDTDYSLSGGTSAGTWKYTSIMDGGNYNNNGNTPPNLNAIELEILGVLEPEELAVGTYTLSPLGTTGAKTYRISNPSDPLEYYLIEARDSSATKWDKYIHGCGLLVYHIDKSTKYSIPSEVFGKNITSAERWSLYNEVNCVPGHQCADLIEADGRADANVEINSLIKGIYFPQTGVISIGGLSERKLEFWDSTFSKIYVKDILKTDGKVGFSVVDVTSPLPPVPTEPVKDLESLYIVVQYDSQLEDDGAVKAGTTMKMYPSNSVNATSVLWFFNGLAIADAQSFTATSSGEIRCEITRSDGNVDYIFKSIIVR